jgi:hypothetical protein
MSQRPISAAVADQLVEEPLDGAVGSDLLQGPALPARLLVGATRELVQQGCIERDIRVEPRRQRLAAVPPRLGTPRADHIRDVP